MSAKIAPIFYFLINKVFFTIICIFISFQFSFGQKRYEKRKDKLNKKLELLLTFPQILSDDSTASFDPDSLSVVIANELVKLLRSNDFKYFDPGDFTLIENTPANDSIPFQILVFGYHSGGSAGWISKPIIIKYTKDTYHVYDLSYTECYFTDLYQLNKNQYLFTGYTSGWGACINNAIYAFDFSEPIERALPVFGKNNEFHICNSDIYYNYDTQIITIEVNDFPATTCKEVYNKEFNEYFSIDCFDDTEVGMTATMQSKFNGNKFVKP